MAHSPREHKGVRDIIEQSFDRAEQALLTYHPPMVSDKMRDACDIVFASRTQAYREVLLGCLLARISDRDTDIRLPYVDLGPRAFSGRSLDEQVVNPLLKARDVPCSKGPYLSVFRRQVRFDETTRPGLKDKQGYDVFLSVLSITEQEKDQESLLGMLDYVLYRFVLLREESRIDLVRLERISLDQYRQLIDGLLAKPSGGLFPSTLVLAMVETIVSRFSVPWEIVFQGINVADKASGAGGDIMVREQGKTVLTIEVTERPVDAARVQATFTDKISPSMLSDYVFLVHMQRVGDEAKRQAERYFTHGYDVNLVDIKDWLVHSLVTVGVKGRKQYQERVVHHLSGSQVPKTLKVAWNAAMASLTA